MADGRSLMINLLDTSSDPKRTCAIEVRDIDPSITEDMMALYFESRRIGGGDIQEIEFDQTRRVAVITFMEPEGGINTILYHIIRNSCPRYNQF